MTNENQWPQLDSFDSFSIFAHQIWNLISNESILESESQDEHKRNILEIGSRWLPERPQGQKRPVGPYRHRVDGGGKRAEMMALGLQIYEPISGFSPEKSIQLSAYFLDLGGGSLEKLKLVKLLYLADRQFFAEHGEPILWDEYFSLPNGPICSWALKCINKEIAENISDSFFVLSGNRNVKLCCVVDRCKLDHLCEEEIKIAEYVWREHGAKTSSQIRNYTHQFCPEYSHVEHGRTRIDYESILAAVGNKFPRERAIDIESFRKILANYA